MLALHLLLILGVAWADLTWLANVISVLLVISGLAGISISWINGHHKGDSAQVAEIIGNWKELSTSLSERLEDAEAKITALQTDKKSLQDENTKLSIDKKNIIASHIAEVSQLKTNFDFERTKWITENQTLKKQIEGTNGTSGTH